MEFVLILRQIIDILTSPKFVEADLLILRNLIMKHNSMYIEFFGALKPKMHIWIHYMGIMKLNGPVVHYWCMSEERKYQDMKNYALSSNCHKNVPWTIAFRNQLSSCKSEENLAMESKIERGTILDNTDVQINSIMSHIASAKTYKYIKIYGKKYRSGTVLVVRVDDDGPVISSINKIYEINGNIYFLLNKIEIIYFNCHYHVYQVINTNSPNELIHVDKLPAMCPPCLLVKKDEAYYVATRFQI